MKKGDFAVIAAVLLFAGLLFALLYAFTQGESNQAAVEIYRNGDLTDTIPLADTPQLLRLETDAGWNLLEIGPDSARITSASCPTQDCVHAPALTRNGQVTACLPHQLLIRLVRAENASGEVDAVAG